MEKALIWLKQETTKVNNIGPELSSIVQICCAM